MIDLDLTSFEDRAPNLETSFRFRFLQQDSFIWFLTDGDQVFAVLIICSFDQVLHVRLIPTRV